MRLCVIVFLFIFSSTNYATEFEGLFFNSWIRTFHKSIGGGHRWEAGKKQDIPKRLFKRLNWYDCNSDPRAGKVTCPHSYKCSEEDYDCLVKSTSTNEARELFEKLQILELNGVADVSDMIGGVDARYKENLKIIFSSEKVRCVGASRRLPFPLPESVCCTGKALHDRKGVRRCLLDDFANVSLYLNKYISSEYEKVEKDFIKDSYDEKSGYLNFPIIEVLACKLNICSSGRIATGVSLSVLPTPGLEHIEYEYIRRFLDDGDDVLNHNNAASFYDRGLQWNNNIYCFPRGIQPPGNSIVFKCDSN